MRQRLLKILPVLALLIVTTDCGIASANPVQGFSDVVSALLPALVSVEVQNKKSGTLGGSGVSDFDEWMQDIVNNLGNESALVDSWNPQKVSKSHISSGAGFIVDSAGYILTSYHVIEKAQRILATLQVDKQTYTARCIGYDQQLDLALLKIDVPHALPTMPWNDASQVRTGDWVLALGNPYGLLGTATVGIISCAERYIAKDSQASHAERYFQTDAPINTGNSGGPLINTHGQVIGIITLFCSPTKGSTGIGFALPAYTAQNFVNQIRAHGYMKRGWLGVHVISLPGELVKTLKLPDMYGAIVRQVKVESELRKGDIIRMVQGEKIRHSGHFAEVTSRLQPGTNVSITLWRPEEVKGLKEKTLSITVDTLPGSTPKKVSA